MYYVLVHIRILQIVNGSCVFSLQGDEKQFKLWFDMPGSTKMPRRLGIDVGLNIGSGRLRGALATPWRVYQAEGMWQHAVSDAHQGFHVFTLCWPLLQAR